MTAIWSLLKGTVLGLALGAAFLVVLSLLGPQPDGTPLAERLRPVEKDEGGLGDLDLRDNLKDLSVGIINEDPIEFGEPSVPGETVELGTAVISGTESAPVPRVGLNLPAPATPNDANLALPTSEGFSPVLPNPLSVAPEVPLSEQDIIIATTPSTPRPPVVVEEQSLGPAIVVDEPAVVDTETPETGTPAAETPDIQEVVIVTDEADSAQEDNFVAPTLPAADPADEGAFAPEDSNLLDFGVQTPESQQENDQEGGLENELVEESSVTPTFRPLSRAFAPLDAAPVSQDIAIAPTSPVVEPTSQDLAFALDIAPADAPDPTVPALVAQDSALVSPQAANDIDPPATPSGVTSLTDLADVPDLVATRADDILAQLDVVAENLVDPVDTADQSITDEAVVQPAQPRASVNEDAVDLAVAPTTTLDDAPDLAAVTDTDVPVATAPVDIPSPDPSVEAALSQDALLDVTRPADPTPIEVAPVAVAPVEEAPAEEAPVEDIPAEETPVETAPVDVAQAMVPIAPETPKAPAPTVRVLSRDSVASSLPTSTGGVRINRSITRDAPAQETADVAAVPVPTDGPATARFAAPFVNAADLPLVTLLLADDGVLDDAAAALGVLETPVTIIIDPTLADAAERAADYRAAGFEVAMSIALPFGATASDAAIVLEAGLIEVPEAVALVDLTQNGLMANREVAGQITQAAMDAGRGLVLPVVGLGGLRSGASDVAMVEIFRDLNGAQQNVPTIRRFLDQAAFRARQQGQVVLTGQLNRETITALVDFLGSARGQQIALAPVSAAFN